MFLSRFFKGLSVALSFALLLTLFSGPQAYAQSEDFECDCSDYEESYLEYKQALQIEEELYFQVLTDGSVPALLEYLSTNNLQVAYENFIMGKANLEDCQKRVEQNAEMCSETMFTEEVQTALMENNGRASLGEYKTVQQLMRFFIEDLSIPDHQAEFELMDDASMEANIKIVIDYLVKEHFLDAIKNRINVRKALRDAAIVFLKEKRFDFRDGDLTKEELTYLRENVGRTFLDSYDTYSKLYDFFLEDLREHADEAGEEYELAREYMLEQHNLMGASVLIKDALYRALQQFFQGLGINIPVLPVVPCPDCAAEQKAVNDKQAEINTKQTELSNAQLRQQAAVDALSQFEADFNAAIDASCEVVADYKAVNVVNGQAAGIIMGVHFYCKSEAEIESMLQKLKDFRASHEKKTTLEEDLKNANRDIANVRASIVVLQAQKVILDAVLTACKRRQKAVPNCPPAVAGVNQPSPANPNTGSTGGTRRGGRTGVDADVSVGVGGDASVDVETTFEYRPTAIDRVVDFRNGNKTRLRALHAKFNTKFDAFQDRVNTSGFSDYSRLDTSGREAVEYLTNRIPLFQGEDGGKSFGEANVLTRAVVAEILFRLATLGEIEYDLDVDGVVRPTDVPADIWFELSVKAAVKNGVFIPKNNKVRPGDNVNWAELVTILRRFYGLEAINPTESTFRNVSSTEWYTGEFETLVEAGILTRAEFALDKNPWEDLTKLQFARLLFNSLGDKASFLE